MKRRQLMEALETRAMMSDVPLSGGDPLSIPQPSAIVVQQNLAPDDFQHAITVTGRPEIIAVTADGVDVRLGTMTDTRMGTAESDYTVWAVLDGPGGVNGGMGTFSTQAGAIADGQGGFDLVAHFDFSGAVPAGARTVHFGVYWTALMGQGEWPATLATGGMADVDFGGGAAPVETPVTEPVSVPVVTAPLVSTPVVETETAVVAPVEKSTPTVASVPAPDATQPIVPTFVVNMNGVDSPLTTLAKKWTIKRVTLANMK